MANVDDKYRDSEQLLTVKHMLKLSDRVCKQWMVDWLMLWRPCGGEEGVHWQW
jgi:hypothetical protein